MPPASYSYPHLAVLYAAWLAMFVFVFARAWVAEDAYITFRVIDNFMNGYGLRWNIGERVQAYTHPLWLLLHIPFYALSGNLYRTDLALSVFCSMTAILVVLCSVRKPLAITLGCFFLPLFASKAFTDYTSSGLETPLSYLLYAAFGYVMLTQHARRYFWFSCSLAVALSMFNRLDTAILYAPTLLWLVYTRRGHVRWRQVLLGALPLIGWLLFSLWYYGFLFPNTKYAKLNTALSLIRYLRHGLHYAEWTLLSDTASVVAAALPLLFLLPSVRPQAPADLPRLPLCSALGAALYIVYVLCVGGDYMMGRFWALPVFALVWTAYVFMPPKLRPDILFAIICALAVGWGSDHLLGGVRRFCPNCLPQKERLINARHTFSANAWVLSLHPLKMRHEGQYPFRQDGEDLAAADPPPVKVMYFIGMAGYYAGPRVTLIDQLALSDPLLARLPASKKQGFFIGHFRRDVPKGYVHAVKTGATDEMDPALAAYYEKLHRITSGDLWDAERLKTIIEFNLGAYDHWKEKYLRSL